MNEYDDLLASEGTKDEARTNLRASVIGALPTNPDQYAEAKRLAKTTGVPAPVVERNMDEVKKQATLNEYDSLIERAPVTASKFQDREFAKLAHDERDQLADLEDFIKKAPGGRHSADMGDALKRGVVQLGVLGESAAYGLDRMLTAIGKRFLPEPAVPGGEVDASSGQVKASLVEVANLYSNLPRDKRTDFAGEIVNRAAAEGKTLRGIGDAIAYIATPGGAMGALNYLIEMTPSAAVGGGIGGLAAKPIATRIASQAVARGVTTAAVTGVGTTTNAFPAELAEQISKGKGVDEALGYAGTKATVEGLVNAPFGFVGGMLPLGATLTGKVGNIVGQAGLQGAGGAVGATAAAASVGEEITPGEQFLEAFFELASAPSDIAIAAATDVAERRNATKVQADQATAAADHLTKIMQAAEASKTRARDPETFAQLVQDAAEASGTAPTEVFIDAQPLVDTLQKAGMTEAQIREALPSVAEQLGTEYTSGGTVAIPIGEAVAAFAGTGAEADLVRFARTTEDGYSVADSEQALAALEEMDADAQRIIAEQQDADAWAQSAQAVEDTLFAQLEGAGRFSSDVNRTYATILRNYYVTQAEVMGITPEALYKQFPLTMSGIAPTGQVLSQPGGVFDWSNPGGKGAGRFHSRDTKIGDTTISYGVGADGTAEIISVRTPQAKRGKGSARQALAKFIEEADTRGLTVKLQASPLDKKTNLGKLVEFYKSLGFEPTGKTINPAGDPEMVRQPPTTFDQEANGTTPYTADTIEVDGNPRPVVNNKGQRIAQTEEGLRNFWRWFGDSKVVDADGRPLVVYHGTMDDIEAFDEGKGVKADPGWLGRGFYFTTNPDTARFYAVNGKVGYADPNTMPVYLKIENPYEATVKDKESGAVQSFGGKTGYSIARRDELKGQGFDGVMLDFSKGGYAKEQELVAFTNTQIKSIFNRGTFDGSDPNILNQSAYSDEEIDFLVADGSLSPEQAATLKADAKNRGQNADARIAGADRRAQQGTGTVGRPTGQVYGRTVAGTSPRSGWEAATRVRGADGQPRRTYRGSRFGRLTAANFADDQLGLNSTHPSAGLGVWFSTDQSDAASYGEVSEQFLDLRNPKVFGPSELPAFDSIEQSIAFREALRAKGHDGIALDYRSVGGPVQFVAFDPEQAVEPAGELYQSGVEQEPRDLYVGHNITAEKIRHALDLGGLPAPSLGVGRTTTGGFGGFGDITLLAPKEILESDGARTFNADVYSPRQPRPVYKPDPKRFDALLEKLRALPGGFSVADIDEVGRYGADALARSDAVKLLYLTETEQAPKLKQQKVSAEIKKAAKLGLRTAWQMRDDSRIQALAKQSYEAMFAEYAKIDLPADEVARLRSRYFEDDGEVTFNLLTEFGRKVERFINEKGVDTGALRQDIAKKLRTPAQSDAFEKWVKDLAAPILGDKKLEISPSRRIPYTLDNVTAQMIKELRGGEGFNYGAGNIRAMFAAELDSVQAVQNRREEIVSGADMQKAKSESQDRLSDTLNDLKRFYKYDANGWGYMDDASRAIAEGPKGWREAFKLNAESEKIIRDYISYVKNLPTEYFETKMQRSVDLSEFTVAIVPKGTPQDVVAALEGKGLTIKTYDPKKPDARMKAIKAVDAEQDILFQSASSSWYFSPLTRAVEGLKQETAPAAQWLATITKQPGVKPDELEWTGLPEFLRAQQGKVTKAQILEFLAAGGVQVDEVMKGGESDRNVEIKRAFNAAGYDLEVDTLNEEIEYTDSDGEPVEFDDLPQELQDVVNANVDVDGAKGATRYDNYVLPGGKNYRELLLTLPAPDRPATIDEVANRMFGQPPGSLDDFQRGMVENEMRNVKGGANVPGYRSSHWHEANILAHVRFDERTDADGKRVLFINEIQSDWGQDGKKKGFIKGSLADQPMQAIVNNSADQPYWEIRTTSGTFVANVVDIPVSEDNKDAAIQAGRDLARTRNTQRGVPTAPFVTKTDAWVALAIKRMIRYAAENGFDRVAFVNGQQAADLYDLSKRVSELRIFNKGNGKWEITAQSLAGDLMNVGEDVATDKLPDYVGKDLANRAVNEVKAGEGLDYSGLDLKVGGDGMRTFYDKIVPKVAGDVIKKLGGGKITQVSMRAPMDGDMDFRVEANDDMLERGTFVILNNKGKPHPGIGRKLFNSREEAQSTLRDLAKPVSVQTGFDITPAMREAALQGLALFQNQPSKAEARGSFNPSTLNIALLEKADLSTFLHETGHFFFEMQATIAARPDAPARIVNDVVILLKEVGFTGTAAEWLAQPLDARREAHEKVAESFEQYLITGDAPTVELQGLFNQMRAWMLAVYKTLKQFFAVNKRAGMSAEVAGVFDRMLASDAAIAETKRVRAMSPLFTSAEAAGMTTEEWAAYQADAGQMDADARRDLDARQVRDMKWLRTARGKALKALQADASTKRRDARIEARRRLLQEPVYRAMQFLRGKVEKAEVEKKAKGLDTRRDDLLTAIAKLGGLNKDLVVAEWGIDPKDFTKSPVFGKPILRGGKAGMSPDGMMEALAEVGYLQPKDGDQYSLADFEAMFNDAARGIQHYSLDADYDLIHGYKTLPVAADLGEQPFAAGRLSRPDLEARFGGTEVDWQRLGVGRRGMIAEVGMDADAVANIVGFNTGEELVKALLAAEPLQDATEALTDQIMLERYGDITSPEGLQRAADEALANDAHAKLLATEYARLNKAVGSPRAVQLAAKEAAERTVDRQVVRLVRPEKATAAAARAGKAAEKAHAAGNLDEAAGFKRNQILNTAIARAQRELRTFVDKAQGDFAKMFGKDDQRAKTRDMNLVNLARAALAQYGLAPDAGGMKALQYLELVTQYDPALAENLKSMLAAMPEGKDFRDLTAGEFRTVASLVRGMWEMSRGVKQITIDGKKVEIDAAADELVAAVTANNGGKQGDLPGYSGTTTTADDLRVGALGIKSMLTRVEQWADFMGPAFKRFIWQPVSEAVTRYRVRRNEMVKQYRDLLKTIEPDLTFHKIHAPELGAAGFTFNAGKSEVLHAILHSGNESNLRKLLLGRGWATVDAEGNVDTSRWDAFVRRMASEGVITRNDMDFVQGVWDLLETVKGDAQKAHRELYGYYFNEVTATPFVDPFGVERRGGYVPALADGLSSPDAMQKREQEELLHAGNSFMFPSTGKGFTQSRVEYNRPLELDLRTIGSHLDKVTRFAYIEPAVRDVGKLLLNKRVSRALNGYDQTIISQMLNPWLQRAARQTISVPGKNRWADKFFNGLRSRAGVVIMFANVVNTLQQITGFSVAALKVPAPALLRATYRMVTDPKRMSAEAAALSPWLAERMAGQSFEMQQEIKNILVNPNPLVKGNEFLKHNAYFLQQAMQNMMDPVVWWGAYDNATANGANQRDAIRAGDEAVRTTQGTFAPEDVSAFESNTAFVRLFTQFYGYFNMLANTLGVEAKKAIRDMGYGAATPRLLFIWFAGLALPAVVGEIIARGLPDDEDDEDGDGILDEWLALFFGSQFRTLAAMAPGVGQGASLVVNLNDDKVYNDRLSISPGMSMAETTIRGGVNLLQGEVFDERLTKTEVRDTLTLIGMATGAPTGAIARSAGYLVDVENGRADPETPVDYAIGLTTGR